MKRNIDKIILLGKSGLLSILNFVLNQLKTLKLVQQCEIFVTEIQPSKNNE